jgi:hypothetical protein
MGNIKSARGKSSSSENDEATLDISELVREENSQNQVRSDGSKIATPLAGHCGDKLQ